MDFGKNTKIIITYKWPAREHEPLIQEMGPGTLVPAIGDSVFLHGSGWKVDYRLIRNDPDEQIQYVLLDLL